MTKSVHNRAQRDRRLAGARGNQRFHHQGDHHLGPALADQAQRAVEIEEDVPGRPAAVRLADDLDRGAGQHPRRFHPLDHPAVIFLVTA